MSAGSQTRSVTEQLERRGRAMAESDYERTARRRSRRPDRMTRITRMLEQSVRKQPVTWALASLGIGCAIGAVWFTWPRGDD